MSVAVNIFTSHFSKVQKLYLTYRSTNHVGDREGDSDKTLLAVQSSICIFVLVVYSALSTKSAPFIKDSDDQVDIVARYTALIIAILGFIASQIDNDNAQKAFGILLNVVTFFGGLIICVFVLSGFKKVQTIIKKILQKVTFTLTRDTGKPLIFSNQLDIGRERKVFTFLVTHRSTWVCQKALA